MRLEKHDEMTYGGFSTVASIETLPFFRSPQIQMPQHVRARMQLISNDCVMIENSR